MNDKMMIIFRALKNGGWKPSAAPGKNAFRSICPNCGTRFDGNPTKLCVGEGTRAPVLIKCFAGCGALEVIAALGLKPAVIFPDSLAAGRGPERWISPAVALDGLADDMMTVAVLAALVSHGEALTEAQHDELAEARARIESAASLVNRS